MGIPSVKEGASPSSTTSNFFPPIGEKIRDFAVGYLNKFFVVTLFNRFVHYIHTITPALKESAYWITAIAIGILVMATVLTPKLGIALIFGVIVIYFLIQAREIWKILNELKNTMNELDLLPLKPPFYHELEEKIKQLNSQNTLEDFFRKLERLRYPLDNLGGLGNSYNCAIIRQTALYPIIVQKEDGTQVIYDATNLIYYKIMHKKYPWKEPSFEGKIQEPLKLDINTQMYSLVRVFLDSNTLRDIIFRKLQNLIDAFNKMTVRFTRM